METGGGAVYLELGICGFGEQQFDFFEFSMFYNFYLFYPIDVLPKKRRKFFCIALKTVEKSNLEKKVVLNLY